MKILNAVRTGDRPVEELFESFVRDYVKRETILIPYMVGLIIRGDDVVFSFFLHYAGLRANKRQQKEFCKRIDHISRAHRNSSDFEYICMRAVKVFMRLHTRVQWSGKY